MSGGDPLAYIHAVLPAGRNMGFSVCTMEPLHRTSLHFGHFFILGDAGRFINRPLDNSGISSSSLNPN